MENKNAKIFYFDLARKRLGVRRWCAKCQGVVSLAERRQMLADMRAEDDRIAETEERRILEINLRILAVKGKAPSIN